MAQLREDKKREILNFLESHVDEDRLLPLEIKQLTERFADETYDQEDIEDIVNQLEDDGLIVKENARLEVVLPKGAADSIEDKFGHLFGSTSQFSVFLLGMLAFALLLEYQPFFEFIYDGSIQPKDAIIRYALFGISGAWILGMIVIGLYGKAQENIEALREYRYIIYPTVVIGAVIGGTLWVYTTSTGTSITPNHILQIASISILGGIAVGKLFLEE